MHGSCKKLYFYASFMIKYDEFAIEYNEFTIIYENYDEDYKFIV